MKSEYENGNDFFKDAIKMAKDITGNTENLKYICTSDMTLDEIAKWEENNKAVCIQFDDGGCLEIQLCKTYLTDEYERKIIGTEEPVLVFSMCNQVCDNEVSELCSSKEDIVKLRDYLNKVIEQFN